jgi:hypothetical protein
VNSIDVTHKGDSRNENRKSPGKCLLGRTRSRLEANVKIGLIVRMGDG